MSQQPLDRLRVLGETARNYDGHPFKGNGVTCTKCGLTPLLHDQTESKAHIALGWAILIFCAIVIVCFAL